MCVPVIFIGQCLGNTVVKVFIVREDDVPANIIELKYCQRAVSRVARLHWGGKLQSLQVLYPWKLVLRVSDLSR